MSNNNALHGKSFLSWVGGKSLLAGKIIPLMPDHKCYVEVFAGAAWLLFKKQESKVEVINDINLDLVTLYRVIQHHLEEFMRYFKWVLVSRDEFDRLKRVDPSTLTDIQRAARFYYVVKTSFGAKVYKPSFGVSASAPPRINLLRLEEELSTAHLRLARVLVENLPYAALIERYDRPHTLFYIDPPYHGSEQDYGKGIFHREDFAALAGILGGVQGKFIMSINDTAEIRALFKGFQTQPVTTRYSLGKADRAAAVKELLISNFKPK